MDWDTFWAWIWRWISRPVSRSAGSCAASQALTVLWQALRKHGGRRVAIEDPGWRWQR